MHPNPLELVTTEDLLLELRRRSRAIVIGLADCAEHGAVAVRCDGNSATIRGLVEHLDLFTRQTSYASGWETRAQGTDREGKESGGDVNV
jgi:hypothetical protein